jgi:hypothetical protein
MPFIFLAIIALGFSTWEGGFYGIQSPNFHFSKFEDVLGFKAATCFSLIWNPIRNQRGAGSSPNTRPPRWPAPDPAPYTSSRYGNAS